LNTKKQEIMFIDYEGYLTCTCTDAHMQWHCLERVRVKELLSNIFT